MNHDTVYLVKDITTGLYFNNDTQKLVSKKSATHFADEFGADNAVCMYLVSYMIEVKEIVQEEN